MYYTFRSFFELFHMFLVQYIIFGSNLCILSIYQRCLLKFFLVFFFVKLLFVFSFVFVFLVKRHIQFFFVQDYILFAPYYSSLFFIVFNVFQFYFVFFDFHYVWLRFNFLFIYNFYTLFILIFNLSALFPTIFCCHVFKVYFSYFPPIAVVFVFWFFFCPANPKCVKYVLKLFLFQYCGIQFPDTWSFGGLNVDLDCYRHTVLVRYDCGNYLAVECFNCFRYVYPI